MKLPSGRFGSCSPARARRIALATAAIASSWPTTRGVQPLLHLEELLDLAFHQPADRDVRPAADDLGDVLLVDLFLEHPAGLLQLGQARFLVAGSCVRAPAAGRTAAPTPSRSRRRCCARSISSRSLLELLLELARRLDGLLLLLPVRRQPVLLFLEVGQLLLELLQPLLRRLVGLLAQRLALDLELHDAPLDLVELGRHRVDLHAQPRRRLVDQVDRLVGQEPIGDVAIRQHRRRDQRGVLELHAVMDLVALAQAAQDADRVLDRRLADHDRLEAPLERRVLLDVLAVLVERGRADACAARRAPASA